MRAKHSVIFLIAILMLTTVPLTLLALDRAEIPDKYKWRPDHIYTGMDEWEKDFEWVKSQLDVMAGFKGTFAGENATNPAQSLIDFNALSEKIEVKFEHLFLYVMYNYHVNMGNTEWAGRQQQMQMLGIKYSQKLAWVEPELLMIPQEAMNRYIAENPELKDYQKSYDDMYLQQEHVLSEAEEAVIAGSYNVTGTASDVFSKLTDVDMTFGYIVDDNGDSIEVTDSGWNSWRVDKNRRIREEYFKTLWTGYENFANTLAALMNGNIKKNVYFSTVRKYDNTLQAALSGNFIPEDVYINLVKATRANLAPLHKYNEIRKRVLSVNNYRHWDYYVSLAEAEETRYTWEEGVDLITTALKPMGKQYIKDITYGLNPKSGWIDAYASENKRGGAYSSGAYEVHPFMLYNFDYEKGITMDGVGTIAHEIGHAMHSYYSEATQPFPNKDYAIFNAEVASTLNQAIFSQKLIADARKAYKKAKKGAKKEAAKQQLIALLDSEISSIRTTFYRQTMFATWEWEANKMGESGQPLTKDTLSKLYYDILTEWHGPTAEYEELSGMSWARIPHFYRGYYVYSYATSYAAAVAMATDVMNKEKGAADRCLNYLKSGSSRHPVELLQDAGVDMATPAPIEALVAYFSSMVDELDELTK
jgi:oligoendopeptidase F